MTEPDFDGALKAFTAVPGSTKKKDPDNRWGDRGTVDCPKCRGVNTLHWARSATNGHARFKCYNETCLCAGIQ